MADKAILLGINRYKSVSGLRGCENDVDDMHTLLADVFDFDSSNIKVLLHNEVTKARVKPLLKWIYQDTREGDRLLLHFSGHGSYTADRIGDELDKRDELICLYDMDFKSKESYFTDDELRDWTRKLPKGRQLVVVLDNCHSGTGTRKIVMPESSEPAVKHPAIITRATDERVAAHGLTRGLSAVTEPDDPDTVIARFIEPPPEILRKLEGTQPRGMLRRELTTDLNHVLLAACRDDQTAADAFIEGQFRGAFTFHLCKLLRSAGKASLSRHALIEKLTASLAKRHFDQIPQFEAATNQGPLFAAKKGAQPMKPPRDADSEITDDVSAESPEPEHLEDILSDAGDSQGVAVTTTEITLESDLPRRMEEFLAAYNRVLEAGGALAGGLAGIRPSVTRVRPERASAPIGHKVVVYVHGICEHARGFSDNWWAALSPFAPGLRPGDLGDPGTTNAHRYEVLWSDIVRGASRDLESVSPTRAAQQEETRQRIVEILEDRARQQSAVQPTQPGADRAMEAATTDRGLLAIPGFDCINDFVQYLDEPTIRQEVQGRFLKVVGPLLRAGASVEVISHSWGTVVAYESLCLLENAPPPRGVVANLFTVGSALSIGMIKSRLIAAARDGHRPRMVQNWVNLDARGDVVGGPLRGLPFAVDHEFLGLDPVGCNRLFPSPVCAHGSYFTPRNFASNRDIFGRFISS